MGKKLRYSFSTYITAFMLLRVYLVMRLFTRYSIYRSAFADKACANVGIEADSSFSMKCIYLENPFLVLFIAMMVPIFVFGFALRLFEQPYYEDDPPYNISPDDDNYQDYTYIWNGMWVVTVTMASIGYGDFYPCSHMGRFITIFATFWGVFLISMSIVSVANYK
jgi:Ion channel